MDVDREPGKDWQWEVGKNSTTYWIRRIGSNFDLRREFGAVQCIDKGASKVSWLLQKKADGLLPRKIRMDDVPFLCLRLLIGTRLELDRGCQRGGMVARHIWIEARGNSGFCQKSGYPSRGNIVDFDSFDILEKKERYSQLLVNELLEQSRDSVDFDDLRTEFAGGAPQRTTDHGAYEGRGRRTIADEEPKRR